MTAEEKVRMLKALPAGHTVTVIDCEIRIGGGRWLVDIIGSKVTELIGYKRSDQGNSMLVIIAGQSLLVPYMHLTCTSIQVLDTICPDDIYNFNPTIEPF